MYSHPLYYPFHRNIFIRSRRRRYLRRLAFSALAISGAGAVFLFLIVNH